jgi:hypothetical protein
MQNLVWVRIDDLIKLTEWHINLVQIKFLDKIKVCECFVQDFIP